VFLAEAKGVLQRAAQAELALTELSGLKRGTLTLYASQTIANYWLPPILHRFHERHPEIALSLVIGNTTQVVRAVVDAVADLGFAEGDVDDPILARIEVEGDRLVLVVGASHPWATDPPRTPADLTATRWVLRERGSGTRQIFEGALHGFGVDAAALSIALEFPSNEAVRSAVEAGAGATVISDLVVADGVHRGTLCRLDLAFPKRRFTVLRHGDRYRSKAEEALLGLIRAEEAARR
jgi:DNA-binding transcriptional LysR family regulator